MKVHVLTAAAVVLVFGTVSRAAAQGPTPQGAASDAKTLYDANCKKCHGVLGTPPKTMVAKFPKIKPFDAEFIAGRSDDSVVKVLTKGKNEDMKSFKDKMSPEQMTAVAKYVRELASRQRP